MGAVITMPKPITAANIILTIVSNTFTGGVVNFYCQYRPLNNTSYITAATPA
jgi:hypothetical protein